MHLRYSESCLLHAGEVKLWVGGRNVKALDRLKYAQLRETEPQKSPEQQNTFIINHLHTPPLSEIKKRGFNGFRKQDITWKRNTGTGGRRRGVKADGVPVFSLKSRSRSHRLLLNLVPSFFVSRQPFFVLIPITLVRSLAAGAFLLSWAVLQQ